MSDQQLYKTDVDPTSSASSMGGVDNSRSLKSSKCSALSRLSRELSDDDLSQPGTKKMILDKLDTLSDENESLKSYQAQYYAVDKQYAVLKEKFSAATVNAHLVDVFFMLGTMLLGLVPWLHDHNVGVLIILIAIAVSICLIVFPRRIFASAGGEAPREREDPK